jgi:hypothetical protein
MMVKSHLKFIVPSSFEGRKQLISPASWHSSAAVAGDSNANDVTILPATKIDHTSFFPLLQSDQNSSQNRVLADQGLL